MRLSCAAALQAVAGTKNLVATGRLMNLAYDKEWVKRLAAVRALTLMADAASAKSMCDFFAKVARREESSAVRWTCLKGIRALSHSAVDPLIVLDDYGKQRLEMLRLVQNPECEHAQRVEAVRLLGDIYIYKYQ